MSLTCLPYQLEVSIHDRFSTFFLSESLFLYVPCLAQCQLRELLDFLGTISNYDGIKTQAHFVWQHRLVQLAVMLSG